MKLWPQAQLNVLLGLGVKSRFLIWFPTEKLKKDKWNSFRRPTAAWEPSHESAQSLCQVLYSQCDPSLLILFCLWLYNFLRQTVCHQTQSSIYNQYMRQTVSLIQPQNKLLYILLLLKPVYSSINCTLQQSTCMLNYVSNIQRITRWTQEKQSCQLWHCKIWEGVHNSII